MQTVSEQEMVYKKLKLLLSLYTAVQYLLPSKDEP